MHKLPIAQDLLKKVQPSLLEKIMNFLEKKN